MRFLADPQGEWAKAARLDWDATTIMGNRRSKRFVAVVEVMGFTSQGVNM